MSTRERRVRQCVESVTGRLERVELTVLDELDWVGEYVRSHLVIPLCDRSGATYLNILGNYFFHVGKKDFTRSELAFPPQFRSEASLVLGVLQLGVLGTTLGLKVQSYWPDPKAKRKKPRKGSRK